jgi:hypothetical protein
MEKGKDKLQTARQHDERIFHDIDAIFNQSDLKELINTIYANYGYKGTQSEKLDHLINFLALENNQFIEPEFADQSKRLSDFLSNFMDFLKRNFQPGEQFENGDAIYILTAQETSFETEAFLTEFQLISMDVENAYKNYHVTIIRMLQI